MTLKLQWYESSDFRLFGHFGNGRLSAVVHQCYRKNIVDLRDASRTNMERFRDDLWVLLPLFLLSRFFIMYFPLSFIPHSPLLPLLRSASLFLLFILFYSLSHFVLSLLFSFPVIRTPCKLTRFPLSLFWSSFSFFKFFTLSNSQAPPISFPMIEASY